MHAHPAPCPRSWLLALAVVAAACAAERDVDRVSAAARGDRCVAGERRCLDDDTPQVCVAQHKQTSWVTQADCGGDAPVCAAGTCVCREGDGDCQGNVARQCVGGAWVVTETCAPNTPICSGGACVCQDHSVECVSDTTGRRCEGGVWVTYACELGCFTGFCQRNTISEAGVVSCDPSAGLVCSGETPICTVSDNYSTFGCSATPWGSSLACDGPNDCPPGTECCKGDYALCGTSCVAEGTCGSFECFVGRPNLTICDPTAPACPDGTTCERVEWVDPDVLLFGCR
jgi:hypothetical protein